MQSANHRLEQRPAPARTQRASRAQPVRLPPSTADLVNRLLEARCGGKAE
jgi:hypothetical protein